MSPDRLIRGNAYLFTDDSGQCRTLLYTSRSRNRAGVLEFLFKMDRYDFIKLTEQDVRERLIQNPIKHV